MSEVHRYDPEPAGACDVTRKDGDVVHVCRLTGGHEFGQGGYAEGQAGEEHACGCGDLWPAPPVHVTTADTLPNSLGPGGRWMVVCVCGWEKYGNYARTNEIAEAVALRLANAFGTEHEKEANG